MDGIQKKVLIEVELAQQSAQEGLQALKVDVDALKSSVVANKAAIVDAKAATAALTTELAKGKVEQQSVKTAIDKARLSQIEANNATKAAKTAIVAANGSYAEAQQRLTALGKAIKNTENGFNSSNAAVKSQIAEYNKLNSQLKAFDAQMGNHQRNVGNYEGALEGVKSQLGRLIPGFDQFSGILQNASKGFSAMGSGAGAAGGEMEAAGIAAGGLSAAILAVAAALAIEGGYLLQFETYSDKASQAMAGLKAATMSFLNQVNTKGGWAAASLAVVTFGGSLLYMAKDAKSAYNQAYEAQGKILELNRQVLISGALSEEENAKIRKDMLVIRNVKSDEITVEKAYHDALKLTNQQYDRNITNQNNLHKALVDKAIAAFKLNKEEVAGLKDVEHGYANILKLAHELTAHDKIQGAALEDLVASAHKGIEIESTQSVREQLIQNREDQKQARLDRQREKADQDAERAQNALLEAKRAGEELIAEKGAALTKMLNDQQEAFAKELSTTDEHYRQLIFKQKEFIIKQEEARNKVKGTSKTANQARAQYGKNIQGANDLIGIYGQGHAADSDKQISDYFKKTKETIEKGQEELSALQIGNIQDVNKRELAMLDQRNDNEQAAFKREQDILTESIEKLRAEIKNADAAKASALQRQLDQELVLTGISQDKLLVSLKKYQRDRIELIKKASDEELAIKDQTAVLKAKYNNVKGTNDSGVLAVDQQQLLDQYNIEVSQKGITDAKKLELEQKYLLEKQLLNQQYDKKQQDYEIQIAQTVSNAAFQIIEQSIARQNQAFQVNLERQKGHELQNKSLTETQKYVVEEKYRVLAGKQKVKEFKQEQEIALAKAAIDTAAAILKASPVVPLMVLAGITGALEIGVIASQKAPAYALGGVHNQKYTSDGRGGLLPGYSKTDNTNAYLRSGEGVVVSEAMQDPWARFVVSNINQRFGGRSFDTTAPIKSWINPGFASGGVFANYLPTADNGLRPMPGMNNGRLHPDDIGSIVNGMVAAVASLPAPITDVKDVNRQQYLLSYVQDRSSR